MKSINQYKNKKRLSASLIGRGGAWLDTGSIEDFYSKSNAAVIEKVAVIVFICLAMMSFTSIVYPTSPLSWIPQNVYIPMLNIVAGLKVTIGAWSVIRLFINKRGII